VHPKADGMPGTAKDAIGRYALVLLQWEDLTRRQAQYEADLTKLEATGDKLRPEWEALAIERQACLAELSRLGLPLEEVIARAWDLFKGQLWLLILATERSQTRESAFSRIRDLAEPLPRNPRLIQ
jgi:hypothetical protein